MTRLIDVDVFTRKMSYLYEYAGWDEREVHFSLADLKSNLDFEKTVEAIPISFIKEQVLLWESLNEKTLPSFYYRELIELWKDKQNDKKTVAGVGTVDRRVNQ